MTGLTPPVAMVFAAGRGRRMHPLTEVLPKPALPVPGGPVVSSGLRLVLQAGIRSAVVNSWWLAETMEKTAAEAAPPDLSLRFSREDVLMETAGGLALARDRGLLGTDGPVLIVNGDGLLNLDLEGLFDRHRAADDLVTLALLPHLGPERWSRVLLGHNDLVTAILPPGPPEPGELGLLYPGVMLVSREALNTLQATPSGVASKLWSPARTQQRLGGVVVSGHWREVGTPSDYFDATMATLGDRVEISPCAHVGRRVVLNRALIGPGAKIGSDVVVGQSIISHGAKIGNGARVLRSIVLGDVKVEKNETLTDEIRVTSR